MKRTVSFIIVLCMLVSQAALVSCNDKRGETAKELVLAGKDAQDYVILRAEKAGKTVKEAMTVLRKAIRDVYGSELVMKTDFVARNEQASIPEREIIIGTAERDECNGIAEEMPAHGFVIKTAGKKLIICGKTDKLTAKAVEYFIGKYVRAGKDSLTLPADLNDTREADLTASASAGMTYSDMAVGVFSDFCKKYYENGFVTGGRFWTSSEMLETFVDAYEAMKTKEYLTLAVEYADGIKAAFKSNWLNNNYNDDLMWITIAYLRLGKATGDPDYYRVAKGLFNSVYKRACDDKLGGGLYWRGEKDSKNSCVNCPAAIAAAYLYEYTKDEGYLDKAKGIIDWVVSTLYDDGFVYDAINTEGGINKWASTYNQGTFIGACTLIWRFSGDEKYIGYADRAVSYTIDKMFGGGVIGTEYTGGDLPGFKGILTRWIYRYAVLRDDPDVLIWLQTNADAAYSHRNGEGLIWTKWDEPTPDELTENHIAFGMSTAVSLMFNSIPWWDAGN